MTKKLALEGGKFVRSKDDAEPLTVDFCAERAAATLDEAVRSPQQANLIPAADLWLRLAELLKAGK